MSIVDPGEAGIKAIIEQMFSRPDAWIDAKENAPGIWKSLWSLITAFRSAWQSRRPARRRFPRGSHDIVCELDFTGLAYSGRTKDISFSGLAVVVDDDFTHVSGQGLVSLQEITLKAALVGVIRYGNRTSAQFRVDSVDKGEEQWHALNLSGWQS